MRILHRTFRAVAAVFVATACVVGLAAPAPAATATTGVVRVDQLGYDRAAPKLAYLMTTEAAPGAPFTVVDRSGRPVLTGNAGTDLGRWNDRYGHVYELDVSSLRRWGSYRIAVRGTVTATSPTFRVGPARGFDAAADKAVTFFASQRDGAEVSPGELRRRPAHLTDRAAQVYDTPEFAGPDTDQIVGDLTRIGGPVDVEGGWFDAGDYLKFTHIIAYADTLLWAAVRDGARGADRRLVGEAEHGLGWLDKMWDEQSRTLYIQVGIGAGNAEGTFVGDHDIWRLPEQDDGDTAPTHEFLRNRPVFRAAAPGEPISPNLAGRTAAAFAIAAQVEARRAPARAKQYLDTAAQIYAQAQTENVGQLVTSLPFAFYPESVWRDDLELGGAELALAALELGDSRASDWLRQAGHWAGEYLANDAGGDTFNLYDTSALAHADLVRAVRRAGGEGLPVSVRDLVGDLRAQLDIGAQRAAADPFRAGASYDNFDAVPHTFGLGATARLYQRTTGDRRYDTFGTQQRNWAFGANPWGVSFMVGVGENFERCPHHQVANMVGRLDGSRPVATGAVVNGPNSEDLFSDGLGDHLDGMRPCPPDGVDVYEQFTGRGSRYVDDVRSWQASEPADDFAAIALYAMKLEAG